MTRSSSSGPRSPAAAGPKATSSRTVGMKSWSSGSWKTMPTRRRISARCRFPTGSPATRDGAGARVEDAVEVQDEGGLARAVGAEQGDAFAAADGQVDAEEGLVAVGVGVGEAG